MKKLYARGDLNSAETVSNNASLFSDDFGGAAVNTNNWTVLPGGQGAVMVGPPGSLAQQAAIGSGQNTGMTWGVAASALTVNMGTVNGDELWFLGNTIFAASEDVTVILSKSQALAANSIWIGLVEVDPFTGLPLLNPNLAADFTNRGGVEFGATANPTTAALQAVGDSSPVVASISQASFSPATMATAFETTIEFHAEDIIASAAVADGIAGKLAAALRLSSQVPNDGKAYKLLMRFRNTAAPGSATTVAINRIVVVESQELRVEVSSGRGDIIGQKAMAVNLSYGGVFSSALPNLGGGQPGALQLNSKGMLLVQLGDGNGVAAGFLVNSGDALSNSSSLYPAASFGRVFNGATWDRAYSGAGSAAAGAGLGAAAVEEAGRAYNNITTATTTNVKSGKGNLHGLTFNTQVAGATVTLYDSTTGSGTKIGTITLPATVGEPFTLPYDVAFTTGLTIVTSAATDITVAYR